MTVKPKPSLLFTVSSLSLLFIFISVVSLEIFYRTKYIAVISPNIYFWGQNVSGYSYEKFSELIKTTSYNSINVVVGSTPYPIVLGDIGFNVDVDQNWNSVISQKKNYLKNPFALSFLSAKNPLFIEPKLSYDQTLLFNEIDKISYLSLNETVFEEVFLDDGVIKTTEGKDGSILNKNSFEKGFVNSVYDKKDSFVVYPILVKSQIPESEKERVLKEANSLIGKSIKVSLDEKEHELSDKDLISTLNDKVENGDKYINNIIKNVIETFDRPAKDSIFVFENGRVTEFTPSESGITTDTSQLLNKIVSARNILVSSDDVQILIDLPHSKTEPKITTGNINNYGIKEKIGSGFSYFRGSISSRIHNIRLASSKFNGVLIAPGEVFSFNKTLGDVSKVTGYQPAYIIRDGQTILGDGGGVCQVSTTFFRAALNAGLPIIERRGHSYRVSYYEQSSPPGIDATVFDPTTDLKIQNNTHNHILIQTTFDEKSFSLIFDLYGTMDGRVVTMTKPIIKEQTAPPEDLYIDDPTLPVGVVKQIDYKAWGAKVYFSYKVEKEDRVLFEKIFYTNYQPWQAKFLRGTGL